MIKTTKLTTNNKYKTMIYYKNKKKEIYIQNIIYLKMKYQRMNKYKKKKEFKKK